MTDLHQKAAKLTGWEPAVVAYIHDEFIETEEGEDFLEYVADLVGNAAFVIGASQGLGVTACLEAYAHGVSSVLEEDFSVDEAIDEIYEAAIAE
jgi:hypothetical protein